MAKGKTRYSADSEIGYKLKEISSNAMCCGESSKCTVVKRIERHYYLNRTKLQMVEVQRDLGVLLQFLEFLRKTAYWLLLCNLEIEKFCHNCARLVRSQLEYYAQF